MKDTVALMTLLGFWLLVIVATAGAWLTHLVVCLRDDSWGFLIAGAIFFPIAMVHGWLVWLGVV